MKVKYDPFDIATIEDPYPAYAELRASGAVCEVEAGFWVVPRYADVAQVLRDAETFSSADGWGRVLTPFFGAEAAGGILIATDAPLHTRLRKTVNRAFTNKRLRDLESQIRTISSSLVDQLLVEAATGPVDIVEDFFFALPTLVIAEILGVDPDRQREFTQWGKDMLLGMMAIDPEVANRANDASEALGKYFADVIAERMKSPADDTVSMLITRGADGEEPLSLDELVAFAKVLILAGSDTTGNSLGNWLSVMLSEPDIASALRADPTKIPHAVEEIFRYDPVAQVVWRAPKRDVEIGGTIVPQGAQVAPLIGSANRDENKWGPDADRFRIDRDTTGNLIFGWGPHMCLGAHLARKEMKIAIEVLLERTRSIESAGTPVRSPNFALRGFTSIPVKLESSDRS